MTDGLIGFFADSMCTGMMEIAVTVLHWTVYPQLLYLMQHLSHKVLLGCKLYPSLLLYIMKGQKREKGN